MFHNQLTKSAKSDGNASIKSNEQQFLLTNWCKDANVVHFYVVNDLNKYITRISKFCCNLC